MNLFERLWKTLDERRENPEGDGLDISITPVHPPDGVQTEAARDLAAVVRQAPKRYPPCVLTQPNQSTRPFCLIHTVAGPDLPEFHELFEQYVDKNAFMAETFLRLKPHCEIPYILFLGERTFFLYDATQEELIRWGNDFGALDEIFLQPLMDQQSLAALWDTFERKPLTQRSEEFGRWLDLWKVGIGARTNATPEFMQNVMQKVILLFLYDLHFSLDEGDLRLRDNFLHHRTGTRKRQGNGSDHEQPFDGIAWLHEASREVREKYEIDFLSWTQVESSFFALMGAETRSQFSQFILELFLLSHCKFDVHVQSDAFSDVSSRLKLWKFAVTETLNIERRLQADDVNVYEPICIDLEQSGIGWALHVVEHTLEFWKQRCSWFQEQLSQRKTLKLQFDMFQQTDLENARVPLLEDVFESTFSSSVRIYYDFPADRATLEYLVILKVFDFCGRWPLGLQPLHHLRDLFIAKQHASRLEEM